MKQQRLIIISIILVGSLLSTAYASSSIITDTSVTTTNVNAVNVIASNHTQTSTLDVTGTCTGCNAEPNFNSWALVGNNTIAGVGSTTNFAESFDKSGNLFFATGNSKFYGIALNGTLLINSTFHNPGGFYDDPIIHSVYSKYILVIRPASTDTANIYKNAVLIQTINIDTTNLYLSGGYLVTCSADGKYIAVVGKDHTDATITRVQVYSGS